MNIPFYLQRIDYSGPVRADADTLRAVHRAHMLTVPFENLDIVPLQRPLALDPDALWNKIVLSRRGGFCYELNGLFASLLSEIGFRVTYLNARVYGHSGGLGIDFDHLALLVQAPGESNRWLADVGFGDSFTEPLSFAVGAEQLQDLRAYRLDETMDGYAVSRRDFDGHWERLYFFDLQPRNFPEDYQAACQYHQSSPASSFTRGSIVSRATPEGRISLEDHRLIVTKLGVREQRPIMPEECPGLLRQHFGIVLEP